MSNGCCRAAIDSEGFAHDHAEWFAEIGRLQSLTTMLGANVDAMEVEIGQLKAERDHLLALGEEDDLWKVAADEWVRQRTALTAERDRLRELTATCSCGTSPMTYEGPQPDCAVHGAVRAFNEASAELAEAYRMRNETMAVLRQMCGQRDAALAAMERAVEERDRMERVAAEKTAAEFERNQLRDELDQYANYAGDQANARRAADDARDAALASLAEERKQTARMREVAAIWTRHRSYETEADLIAAVDASEGGTDG